MCKIKYHTIFTIIEQVAQPKAAIHTHTHIHTQSIYTERDPHGETHIREACGKVLGSIAKGGKVEIGTTSI